MQQNKALSTSQRLWNDAYDRLEKDDDTAKLVRSYVEVLENVLKTKKASDSSATGTDDVSVELKEPAKREKHMRDLVVEGQAKVSKASKIKKGVGDVSEFILLAKDMIGTAIQNIPQAALPWAGVCVGLQVRTNPLSFTSLFSASTDVCPDPLESCKSDEIQSCRHYLCCF
jgi:N-terminal domain of NWD NACHT-NTPase